MLNSRARRFLLTSYHCVTSTNKKNKEHPETHRMKASKIMNLSNTGIFILLWLLSTIVASIIRKHFFFILSNQEENVLHSDRRAQSTHCRKTHFMFSGRIYCSLSSPGFGILLLSVHCKVDPYESHVSTSPQQSVHLVRAAELEFIGRYESLAFITWGNAITSCYCSIWNVSGRWQPWLDGKHTTWKLEVQVQDDGRCMRAATLLWTHLSSWCFIGLFEKTKKQSRKINKPYNQTFTPVPEVELNNMCC